MQALIFLILLVCLSIFWLQNPQNIVLIFFGTPTSIQLSLATWMLIFAITGAMTSFLIQLLATGGSQAKSNPKKQRSKSTRETETASPPFRERDWDNAEDSEWEIETPPKTPPIPTYRPEEYTPPPLQDTPVPEPKQSLREPSIYSYTPPKAPEPQQEEPKKPKPESKDIYDANYRVITPPYPKSDKTDPQNDPEEEDWI